MPIGTRHSVTGLPHHINKMGIQMEPIDKAANQLTQSATHFVAQVSASQKRLEAAVRHTTQLLSFYPEKSVTNADVFVAACVAILAHFPEDIAQAVVDPVSGLPSKLKWFPSLAEIRTECDQLNNAARAADRRASNLAKQIAESQVRDQELATATLPVADGKTWDKASVESAELKQAAAIQELNGKRPNEVTRAELEALYAAQRGHSPSSDNQTDGK